MKTNIIDKYNISVPRYTSYPPANYFAPFTEVNYIEALHESNFSCTSNLSFYFHIPFCRRLCHYCGCNSYPMQKEEGVQTYVDALHKEIDLVVQHLDKSRHISQIHYGGGSPTSLPASVLQELNEHLLTSFPTIEQPEIAIECHPGYLEKKDWENLLAAHFNRFSIGVQDLDTEVLKIVNRTPSKLPLTVIMQILREGGASINMDFLFGLPHQTPESFQNTIHKAIELYPDRLTTFSYGHCPWIFKRQMILERAGLPTSESKSLMFKKAEEVLLEAGYKEIGLDHFVLPTDELAMALNPHQLHRNFQGYCTRRTTGQVYAFGVTGISQLETAYAQGTKSIDEYISTLANNHLPISKGYLLSPQQKIVRAVIEQLMCNYHIEWDIIARELNISKEALMRSINFQKDILDEMQNDGLITLSDASLTVLTSARPFVRNVAATLDPMMLNTDKQFSKPL